MGEGWQLLLTAFFDEIIGEFGKIATQSSLNNGVIRLISLDDDIGDIEVAAPDASDDLSEKFKSALFGGKIG